MSTSAVLEFERRWKSAGAPPEVFAFLSEHEASSIQEKLGVLLRDQRYRWQNSVPLVVEEYVTRLPELNQQTDARLHLILSEYELRSHYATAPELDAFVNRFADLADTLRNRLATEITVMSDDDVIDQTLIQDAPQELVGRYRLGRVLGQGAYGCVYLGVDSQLQRAVAVKVPKVEHFREHSDADSFLKEARLVAGLDHPHIVPVHDVGRTSDGAIYIVSKFVEGVTLRELLRNERPDFLKTVHILIRVAQALHHAHERGLVHRDVKPGNILIEASTGEPYITDFGLAVRDADFLRVGLIAGTPSYMSPEQARGEGHRLDGRSDLFALAAIFYLMLTGRKAFGGTTTNEILHQVVSEDPPPATSIEPSVPQELERICRKAMSKQISSRHASAAAFASELQEWQSGGNVSTQPVARTIVPHGLRSFGEGDADFFAELLPGPRDRNGVPESVQFWVHRMEETDPDATFRVGLIYGPSGSGKSSLIKAAILPRLSGGVKTVYIEATAAETESRLLRGVRKRFPELARTRNLVQSLQWLRQREGEKVVVVIDQFEQWLHANTPEPQLELIRAFGQCDGGSLQAVVLIRDDFAMAAARFMEALDIPIAQGENFATVDLFDEDHAAKVLRRFGQAFGRLPASAQSLTTAQTEFLGSMAAGLAKDGHVVPVQLALFAEMIKGKAWESATLEQVGGTTGVGANFLEETFGSRSANPAVKKHERAAREVLKALLPETGSDIKGHMQSHADLLQTSGYQNREAEFNDLLRILDGGLRLITPTDPDGHHSDSGSGVWSKHYQLTHDYLVPSLRDWLTRKQQATRTGRAELLLAQRAALWAPRHEARQLPSMLETASIGFLTRAERRTPVESEMLATAKKRDFRRLMLAVLLLVLMGASVRLTQNHFQQLAELDAMDQLVDQVLVADAEKLATLVADVSPDDSDWQTRWQEIADDERRSDADRLRAHVVLAPNVESSVRPVVAAVAGAVSGQRTAFLASLKPQSTFAVPLLWEQLLAEPAGSEATLNLAGMLAVLDPSSGHWPEVAGATAAALLKSHPLTSLEHVEALTPVREHLLPLLENRLLDTQETGSARARSASILSRLAADNPEKLVSWIVACDADSFNVLFDALAPHQDAAVVELKASVIQAAERTSLDAAERHANAAIALLLLNQPQATWRILNDISAPTVRTELIHSLVPYGVPVTTLTEMLSTATEANAHAGLLLALGEYRRNDVSGRTNNAVQAVVRSFRNHPDAAVQAAAAWLLRQWQLPSESDPSFSDTPMTNLTEISHRRWWTTGEGRHVMVNLRPVSSFQMGSPETETERDPIEGPWQISIERPFAIGQHEVTVEQFLKFKPDLPYAANVAPSSQCPINKSNWLEAVSYCRWLSDREGISEDQMCYPPLDRIGPEMVLPDDVLKRTGYRLPTEAEWEYACRAESPCRWYFGDDSRKLEKYVWYGINSQERTWPVGRLRPNAFGLFDVSGNVLEWCHNLSDGGTDGSPAAIERGADVGPGERFLRGGSYKGTARLSRSAKRYTYPPKSRLSSFGFRIARTLSNAVVENSLTTRNPESD